MTAFVTPAGIVASPRRFVWPKKSIVAKVAVRSFLHGFFAVKRAVALNGAFVPICQ